MINSKSTFTQEFGYIIDTFDELQDLRYSDLQYLDEYRNLKMRKNDGLAIDQNRLDELELIFKNKIVTSARWNKFQNALVGMQTFIKDEVEGYIEVKQQEFQNYIDRFDNKNTFNPNVQYYKNNYVSYNDGSGNQLYIAIANPPLGVVPTNITYWRKLTIKGEKGEDGIGIGLTFRGTWSNSTTYRKDDAVQYGGLLFASLIDGNIDNQPDLTQDTAYWGKALEVAITSTELIGIRNVATQTNNVNFMTGEITAFNPNTDILSVYINTTRKTKGVDYNINPNNQSIDKISGTWDGTPEEPVFFEFVVKRNQVNNLVFSDGQSIADGTITKSKLSLDVQDELDKSELVGAINEVSTELENYKSTNAVDLQNLNTTVTTHLADGVHEAEKINLTSVNFISNNVKAGMDELFISVSNGKNLLETAIADKEGSVSKKADVPTFNELKNGIESIPTGVKIKSVQRGLITIPQMSTSATANISNVNLNTSVVIFNGQTTQSNDFYQIAYLFLTNSTTVTATRRQSATNSHTIVAYTVLEFEEVKSIQKGISTIPQEQTSNTIVISSVKPSSSFVICAGVGLSSSPPDSRYLPYIQLTNATTLTLSRGAANWSGGVLSYMSWAVIEF